MHNMYHGRSSNPVDWNSMALTMIPVLILMLVGIVYVFNANSDNVYFAYYHITNQTHPYDGDAAGDIGPIFLPHHILLILITIGILVVVSFAIYILNSIDGDDEKTDLYTDSDF